MLRQVITVMMGNVDAGKSQIIDTLKRTTIVKSEPGKITQSIKAYSVSLDVINKICSNILNNKSLKIPGILILDTPGHAAFTHLRKRGGSLADLAILVVAVKEGIKPQTAEVFQILRANKTPFLIALNKIDTISGWKKGEKGLKESIKFVQSKNIAGNVYLTGIHDSNYLYPLVSPGTYQQAFLHITAVCLLLKVSRTFGALFSHQRAQLSSEPYTRFLTDIVIQ